MKSYYLERGKALATLYIAGRVEHENHQAIKQSTHQAFKLQSKQFGKAIFKAKSLLDISASLRIQVVSL